MCSSDLVLGQVEPISRLAREIDPTDEGDAIVDDDRLFVVAVKWTFLRIETALDARSQREIGLHPAHIAPRRAEERQWSARPRQDSHIQPFGKLCQEVPQDYRLAVTYEDEVRREVPARDVDLRLGSLEFRHHRGKGTGAVDEHLERVSRPRRRHLARPPSGRRIEGSVPADSLEPAFVVTLHPSGYRVTDETVGTRKEVSGPDFHQQS